MSLINSHIALPLPFLSNDEDYGLSLVLLLQQTINNLSRVHRIFVQFLDPSNELCSIDHLLE